MLWVFGLILLVLELSFAYLFQHFLSTLELIPVSAAVGFSLQLSLNHTIVLIILVAFARSATGFAQVVIGGGAIERFSHRLRRLLVQTSLDARTVKTAETLTFFNQRIYTASMAIQSFQALLVQGTLVTGLLISLFCMGPVPTMLMLMVVAIALVPVHALNRRGKQSAVLHSETLSKIMLHLNNVFRNFLLIRLFNLQEREKIRIQDHLNTYSRHVMQYYWIDGLAGAVVPLVVVLNILWLAFVQNSAVAIDRGLAVPYLYLSLRLAQNLAPVVSNVSRLNFASTQFSHIFHWWFEQEPTPLRRSENGSDGAEVLPVETAIGWDFQSVTFGYSDHDPLFNRFDLEVAPGSLISIRGASGAGKSTLVQLMTGELAATNGSVLVQLDGDSFPVGTVGARLREHMGYSGTEPYLFEGTIYENITYGLKAVPEEGFLLESVERAECQFIFDFPNKFDHHIDELGQGLSTGQKQRLSLLRALLRKPRALILDEALSNVDIPTVDVILKNLFRTRRICTTVLISHREQPGIAIDKLVDLDEPH